MGNEFPSIEVDEPTLLSSHELAEMLMKLPDLPIQFLGGPGMSKIHRVGVMQLLSSPDKLDEKGYNITLYGFDINEPDDDFDEEDEYD